MPVFQMLASFSVSDLDSIRKNHVKCSSTFRAIHGPASLRFLLAYFPKGTHNKNGTQQNTTKNAALGVHFLGPQSDCQLRVLSVNVLSEKGSLAICHNQPNKYQTVTRGDGFYIPKLSLPTNLAKLRSKQFLGEKSMKITFDVLIDVCETSFSVYDTENDNSNSQFITDIQKVSPVAQSLFASVERLTPNINKPFPNQTNKQPPSQLLSGSQTSTSSSSHLSVDSVRAVSSSVESDYLYADSHQSIYECTSPQSEPSPTCSATSLNSTSSANILLQTNGSSFHVHSDVLASCQSEILREISLQPTKNYSSQPIQKYLPGISACDLRHILRVIYLGVAPEIDTTEQIIALSRTSEKLRMNLVKVWCEQKLMQKLDRTKEMCPSEILKLGQNCFDPNANFSQKIRQAALNLLMDRRLDLPAALFNQNTENMNLYSAFCEYSLDTTHLTAKKIEI